ncbi:hypothetical protein [Vulcanisaeta thermophila]|uniref:hypothetical protein n=1 Tax=Vulcanisaeta thermophila TaxID=867917 RepID=UPI0008538693|nr:hypothetical protein [Vulcanisaeta thermophila]
MYVVGDCRVNCEVRLGGKSIIHRRFTHGNHIYETSLCAVIHGDDVLDKWCVYEDGYVERRGSVNCGNFVGPNAYKDLIPVFMDLLRSLDPRLFDSLFNSIISLVHCG